MPTLVVQLGRSKQLLVASCLLCQSVLVIAGVRILVCVCWAVACARPPVTEEGCFENGSSRFKLAQGSYLQDHAGRRLHMFQ